MKLLVYWVFEFIHQSLRSQKPFLLCVDDQKRLGGSTFRQADIRLKLIYVLSIDLAQH